MKQTNQFSSVCNLLWKPQTTHWFLLLLFCPCFFLSFQGGLLALAAATVGLASEASPHLEVKPHFIGLQFLCMVFCCRFRRSHWWSRFQPAVELLTLRHYHELFAGAANISNFCLEFHVLLAVWCIKVCYCVVQDMIIINDQIPSISVQLCRVWIFGGIWICGCWLRKSCLRFWTHSQIRTVVYATLPVKLFTILQRWVVISCTPLSLRKYHNVACCFLFDWTFDWSRTVICIVLWN